MFHDTLNLIKNFKLNQNLQPLVSYEISKFLFLFQYIIVFNMYR